ncbi:MAG: hypothetical protein ACLQAT_13580 [Candidatus Binataceae bacterium]
MIQIGLYADTTDEIKYAYKNRLRHVARLFALTHLVIVRNRTCVCSA